MDERGAITEPGVAVAWLLRAVNVEPTGDEQADLELALLATMRVRELNSVAGGMVIDRIHDDGMPWAGIATILTTAARKPMSVRTVRRWATSPGGTEDA